jgi:hypothetical protein
VKYSVIIGLLACVVCSPVPRGHAIDFDTEPGTGDFVNLWDADLTVTAVEIVDRVVGSRNQVITPSRENACLLELRIEGVARSDGKFGLYPAQFSVCAEYRRVPKLFPSIAVGVKPRLPGGEIEEFWLNEPDASMMVGATTGESIDFYALFEVPLDAKTFYLQIPYIAQGISIP